MDCLKQSKITLVEEKKKAFHEVSSAYKWETTRNTFA
jgi:hypothetical protein